MRLSDGEVGEIIRIWLLTEEGKELGKLTDAIQDKLMEINK